MPKPSRSFIGDPTVRSLVIAPASKREIVPIIMEHSEMARQRIVGFLTPVTTYSKERKAEFAKRDWFELDRMREIG